MVAIGDQDAGDQRHRGQDPAQYQRAPPEPAQKQQEQRQEDIELLLDRQRPSVQQELLFGRRVEVSGPHVEENVRQIGGRGDQRLAELVELEWQQDREADHAGDQAHGEIGRGQSAEAADIEFCQRDPAGAMALGPQDRADQEARDHEENVDTDETAGKTGHREVEQHHRQNGDAAQPVDLGPVLQRSTPQRSRMSLRPGRDAGADDNSIAQAS